MRDLRDAAAHGVRIFPEILECEGELVPDGVADDLGIGILPHEPDARGGFAHIDAFDGHSFAHDGDPVRRRRPAVDALRHELGFQRAQQRRLARARRSDDDAERAFLDEKRGRRQGAGGKAGIGERKAANIYDRHARRSLAYRAAGARTNDTYGAYPHHRTGMPSRG